MKNLRFNVEATECVSSYGTLVDKGWGDIYQQREHFTSSVYRLCMTAIGPR